MDSFKDAHQNLFGQPKRIPKVLKIFSTDIW